MRHRIAFLAALSTATLACGGALRPEAPVEPGPPAEAEAAPPPAPEPSPPAEDPPAAPAREQVVAAFLADCRHVFPAAGVSGEEAEMGSDAADECRWRPFDQNCAEDPFACFTRGQECLDGCRGPCTSCQEACADTCGSCRAGCAGDAACERACAEARAACRDACLAGRGACEAGCTEVVRACDEDGARAVSEKCPDCADLQACLWRKADAGEPREPCLEEHPGNAPECLGWCFGL